MKLTNEYKTRIKETLTKKHSLKEGIVDYIFGKVLTKQLKKDKDFLRMAKKLDDDMEQLRKKVEDMKKRGEKIPNSYKAILNIN
jgi:hypothetical protein